MKDKHRTKRGGKKWPERTKGRSSHRKANKTQKTNTTTPHKPHGGDAHTKGGRDTLKQCRGKIAEEEEERRIKM
jgi:hypothetical protein